MKTFVKISKYIFKSGVVLVFITALISCDRKMDVIKKSDILSLPSMTVKDFESVVSDSGKLQLVMSSSLMEKYVNSKPPYSEFRNGIKVMFYDGNDASIGSLTSKYAKLDEDKNLWELRDSVVIVNEKAERLETELLFWDRLKDLVYTDRFVKITTEDEIVMGIGLESNPRFTKYVIKNVSATISI